MSRSPQQERERQQKGALGRGDEGCRLEMTEALPEFRAQSKLPALEVEA